VQCTDIELFCTTSNCGATSDIRRATVTITVAQGGVSSSSSSSTTTSSSSSTTSASGGSTTTQSPGGNPETSLTTLTINCDKANNAQQLSYPNLETVGTLTIDFDECRLGSTNFPNLRTVTNDLIVRLDLSEFEGFNLPALETIGGGLTLNFDEARKTSVSMPKLRSIGQTLKVRLDDSALENLRLPALESVGKVDMVADDSTLRGITVAGSSNP